MRKNYVLTLVCSCLLAGMLSAQPVYERHTYEVYNYLARMAQKGLIVFNDLTRPLSRDYIKSCLDSLSSKDGLLSVVEKKELSFYQREYTEWARKRAFNAAKDGFTLQADPIITGSYTTGTNTGFDSRSLGLNFWGRAGKNWGYQFSFQDVNLKGRGLDTTGGKTLEAGAVTGMAMQYAFMKNKINYTELRGHISYSFKNGSISVGQDYLLWGYGETGRLVLSDKAPVYPYLRFDYQPLPWLRFNYTHAWLRSNVIDSSGSYPYPGGVFTGIREVEVSKYMASHSIDITLAKGLNFALGESIIYNDKLQPGYLIPILFFKAVDNANNTDAIEKGSNGQFFFQINSRNQLKNTHLYSTLFIDEISLGGIFNKQKQRNQLGYTVGGTITDIGLPYLTIGMEYTRVRPFVYRNFLPAQNYTHQGYLLGDWMGSNADRVSLLARYTPLPRLKLQARYTHIRKGGEGTLAQQYEQQPQPPFLFDFKQRSNEVLFNVQYEWIPRFYLNMNFQRFDQRNRLFLGLTYGL